MDPITVGIIGIIVLLVLIVIGMPIGFVMCIVGFGGYAYLMLAASIGVLFLSFVLLVDFLVALLDAKPNENT